MFFQILLLVLKLFLNNGYKSLKVLILNFFMIRLISNFYDMYIMYFIYIYIILHPKFKKLNNGYEC